MSCVSTMELSKTGVGKLSSEMHLSLWNAVSCPRSRQLSLVSFKGDYAILALRNYKMQAEKRYSYLTIVKLLTPFRSMKHSRNSLEMQFVVYKAVTATLLHAFYVFLLKWSVIIVHLARYLHSASGCRSPIISVIHK